MVVSMRTQNIFENLDCDPVIMHRALDLTYKHKLSHLSSVFNALPVLQHIYDNKEQEDLVILSAGHAGLAQYILLEREYMQENLAEILLEKHGIHPCTDHEWGITVSTGSLGCGLPIAIGLALADSSRNVYCVLTDGECAEGSVWESLRFIKTQCMTNLKIYVIINGQSAYDVLDCTYLKNRLIAFLPDSALTIIDADSYFNDDINGLLSHYRILSEEEYIDIGNRIDKGLL